MSKKDQRDREAWLYRDVPSMYIPHKKIKAQKAKGTFTAVFLIGFAVIAFIGLMSIDPKFVQQEPASTSVQSEKISESDANIAALILCKAHVKNTLRAPRTAEFPWVQKATFDGSLAILSSYVDAQNGFGAMIRTNYICTVRYNGGEPDKSENWNIEEFITLE